MKSIYYQPISFTLFILLLFSFSTAHNKTKRVDPPSSSGCFSKVYAFGDSGTDENELKKFNFSTCPVVDFVCAALSIPPLPHYKSPSPGSFHGGINFAVSGSTSLDADSFGSKNMSCLFGEGVPMSFKTHCDWFVEYVDEKAGREEADVENALFWVGQLGVSDYISAQGSSVSIPAIAKSSVKYVSEILTTIISKGAKYIVVQGLPPVGCFPCYMSSSSPRQAQYGGVLDKMGCMAGINAGVSSHNEILQWALESFRTMYPHCTIVYADYWNAYLTIAADPKSYGMEETFRACCGSGDGRFNFNKDRLCGSPDGGASVCKNPREYVHWDGIRLTEAMQKHLADLFLYQGFCHPCFQELVKKKSNV